MTPSKIEFWRRLRVEAPEFAFDAVVLADARTAALEPSPWPGDVVLRPEFSTDTGSALIRRSGHPLPAEEIAALGPGRVLAHRWVPGVAHFLNGVVVHGEFVPADLWRCLTIDLGPRDLLTSVINEDPTSMAGKRLIEAARHLTGRLSVPDGPICLELVLTDDSVRVVKTALRVAGAPLPWLAEQVGGHTQHTLLALGARAPGTRPAETEGFIADYALAAHRSGTLVEIIGLDLIRGLPSYAGDLSLPVIGTRIERTVGEGGAGAVLLRHHDADVLSEDVAELQRLNRAGVFRVSRDSGEPEGMERFVER